MTVTRKHDLDYRIVIKPDKRIGSDKSCYVATCPTLNIADDGDTIEEALKNIHRLIIFHLKCLQEEGKEIPIDNPREELVTNTQIQVSSPSIRLAV